MCGVLVQQDTRACYIFTPLVWMFPLSHRPSILTRCVQLRPACVSANEFSPSRSSSATYQSCVISSISFWLSWAIMCRCKWLLPQGPGGGEGSRVDVLLQTEMICLSRHSSVWEQQKGNTPINISLGTQRAQSTESWILSQTSQSVLQQDTSSRGSPQGRLFLLQGNMGMFHSQRGGEPPWTVGGSKRLMQRKARVWKHLGKGNCITGWFQII